ncbi:MAG: LysR substrate-binding domain-containing protein [Rudaea sp.]|uniref:LysR substrate-binding domain-containing protein n=1 Tax=Rudaea sp. TaxID=2136325 RepID=UPI0039E44D4B
MKFTTLSIARKLKFYQLIVYAQVLESGSILRAAQALNLTQPSVTKVIHELESYFGAALLVRGNRGVTATPLGERILQRSKSFIADLRLLTDEVNSFLEGSAGHVIVGTLISASAWLLPRATQLLKQKAPKVLLSLRVGQMDQLFPALADGELDLVVGRIPDDWNWRTESPLLKVEPLYREALSVVAGARHPMHRKKRVEFADLREYPWVLPTRDSFLRRTADALFAESQLPIPENVVESLSILTNITLMQDQRTIALMPREAIRNFAEAGLLREFDLGALLHFGDIGCFYSATREPTPAALMLRECLRAASREHVRDSDEAKPRR